MPRLSAPSRRDCSPDSALAARSRRGGVASRHRCIAAVPAAVLALLLLAAPGLAAQTEVWTATLTPADLGFTLLGCANTLTAACNNTSYLSDDDFTHESTTYTIVTLALRENGNLELDFTGNITALNAFTLMVGSNSYLFSAGSNSGDHGKIWYGTGLSLTAGTGVEVKLVIPAPPTLVSNIGQTVSSSSATLGTTQDLSQGFTTATTAGTLDSIEVKFAAANDGSAHPTVTLHRGSPTSTAIVTLTAPSGTIAATAANYTYTAPSNTTLTAATTYYVVLEGSDDDLAPQITTSDNEDSGGETGWSVANGYGFRTASSVGAFTTSSSALLIRVNGTAKAVTVPGAPTSFMARAGDGEVTLSWAAPASNGGGAITNYRYRHTTGSTVASTRHWTDVPDGSDAGSSAADETGLTITGLTNGTEYAFEVLAENSAGEGAEAAQTATPAVETCAAPSFGTRRSIWTGSLTVGTIEINMGVTTNYGFTQTVGGLDDKTFTIGSNDHEIDTLTVTGVGGNVLVSLKDADLSTAEKASLRLHVCNTPYDFSAASARGGHSYFFTADLDWSSISSRTLYLSLPANNDATGKPTITGPGTDPNKVGSTLTAAKGDIADTDGVPATLSYQWVRVDGSDETDIDGATSSSYTLALEDTGLKVKVKASFTDNLNSEETRTSDAYPSSATVEGLPKITIAPGQAKATGKLDFIHYTLTRAGATTAAQTVTVTLDPPAGNDWNIPNAKLSHDVTFAADSATAALSIKLGDSGFRNIGFSDSATTGGTLTARIGAVSGFDNRDTAEVEVVVVTGPAWVFRLTETAYSFAEDGGAQTVTVEARATSPDIPSPTGTTSSNAHLLFAIVAKAGTATAADYATLSVQRSFAKSAFSADGDSHLRAEINVTFTPTDDTLVEPHETLTLELEKPIGLPLALVKVQAPDGTKGAKANYPVTIKDDDTGLLSMAVTSAPALMASGSMEADTYGEGNMIEFTATFNNEVTVSGTPEFEFVLGTANKRAAYVRGSDSTELVFSYTVVAADTDSDGISWAANKIVKVSSATIREMGETTDAVITHALQGTDSGHKVDGSQAGVDRPAVSIAAVYPNALIRVANPEFRVTIAAAQTSAVTVNLSIAQAASYLSSTTQSIEIQANETSATGKFSGFYGGTTSGDLTATVAAGTGYVPAATPANAATVSVLAPGLGNVLSYQLDAAAHSVTEGDSLDVVVTLRTAAGVPKPRESFNVSSILTEQLTGEPDRAILDVDYTHTSESGGAFAPDAWTADGAVFTATRTYTVPTIEDSAYEGNERFKILLTPASGAIGSKGTPGETIVTIVDDEALKVTGVAVSSTPSSGDAYGAGETISFTATFRGPVTVTGTPQLSFSLGGVTKQAAYASGSDTTALVFSYTVAAGDNDADGISWAADSLSLNGGTIKFMTSVVANRVDAALTHAAKTAQSGHKVDTAPVLSTPTVDGTELVLTYNEALDTASEPGASAFTVKVGGTAVSLASSNPVAVAGSTVTLTLAATVAAAATVTVSYAVPGSNPLQDAGGTDAPAFTDLAVTNGTGNTAPAFANATAARSFTETVGDAAVAAAGNVGAVVTATDGDGDTLTYSLEGADAAKFTVNSSSGQIRTKAGERYDREAKVSYSVTVKASDGMGGSDTIAVTISVADAVEIPLAPVAPTVAATSGITTSLDVRWRAPANTGRPALSGYKLRYRQGSSGGWTDHAHSGAGTSATIAGLAEATAYEVQVRALNADGDGAWSASGSGTTGSLSNNAPAFSSNTTSRSFTETVGDAVAAASNVGAVVTATDADGDTLTYSLEGTDAAKFTVNSSSGQLRTRAGERYDREAKASYAVRVKADDGNSGADTVAVTITLANAVEIPLAPDMPAVSATSGNTTSLDVRWTSPGNAGRPVITGYKLQYRQGGSGGWTAHAHSGTGTSTTLGSLATDTTYQVQVRALNADGDGPWSAAGSRSTGAVAATVPGAPRGFTAAPDNARVTLSWSAPASDGGAPITTYRYRHETRTMSLSGAAWTEVPDSDADGDGADEREVTVTGLTNGTEYPFEVQALNSAGGGAAARTRATPAPRAPVALIRPSAPRELQAEAELYHKNVTEMARVMLSWTAPADLGNTSLVRYEYRYAARGAALSSAEWYHGSVRSTRTVSYLEPGAAYRFEVRAVTLAGAGPAAAKSATTPAPARLTLSVFTRGAAVEGENLTIGVRRSGLPGSDKVLLAVVDIHDSAGSRWSVKGVEIPAGAREATATFRVPFDGKRGASRELTVSLGPRAWTPEGRYTVGTSPATTTVRVRNRDPLLRVANATVREGPQAQLSFDVSLDRAAAVTVTVDYATSDGTATAGADYTATSDTLSFAAGETAKTVSVAVLDDAHDEGIETLTLTLSNARGAAIDDATATGRIINTDPMPAAWLARFGRTGATQVLGLLDARFDEARAPASQLTLGGRPVNLSGLRGAAQGRADPGAEPAAADADPFDVPDPAGGRTAASPLTLRGGSQGRADPGAEPGAGGRRPIRCPGVPVHPG